MKRTRLTREIPLLAIVISPIIYTLFVWNKLPDQLPIHWNIKGEADNYGPRYVLPLLNMGLYLLLLFIPLIDPKRKNYALFDRIYYRIRLGLSLFFSALLCMVVYDALHDEVPMQRYLTTGIFLLLAMLGNYMVNLKPNWFIGIRTPWTLSHETVWRKTHQLAGRLWFWGNLLMLIISFFLPIEQVFMLLLYGSIALAIIPALYSYLLYRKVKSEAAESKIEP